MFSKMASTHSSMSTMASSSSRLLSRVPKARCAASIHRRDFSGSASAARAPLLFTPGPLTTSDCVKQAMLRDVGSRDEKGFLHVMHDVRKRLVHACNTDQSTHDCVIVQGAGTHAIESVIGSVVGAKPTNKVLILNNGAYGVRQQQICTILGIDYESIDYPDDQAIDAKDLDERLSMRDASSFTHVSMIHHETTAGVLNDLEAVCNVLDKHRSNIDLELIVDSMSAFGAYPVHMKLAGDDGSPAGKHSAVNYLISSANKCMEGVPGFSFSVYRKSSLAKLEGMKPKSLALDLFAQAKGLTTGNGQFRFTPPTQSILAYHRALVEWEAEGGVEGRGGRYEANYNVLKKGVEEMGLGFYVDESCRGYIISTILSPKHENWDFEYFYNYLSDHGFVIYPGKLSKADSFRLGTIGKVYPDDCENLLCCMREAFKNMKMELPLKQ